MAPAPQDAAFPLYQQFLHLGEAGLAASIYFVSGALHMAPEGEKQNFTAMHALDTFETRMRLVTRQLAKTPYLAGDAFTAADISVVYALELGQRNVDIKLGDLELAYLARCKARDGYKRCMAACHDTRGWAERVAASRSPLSQV
jgi:glutathione S-transferase/3-isopropylmalate dehydratase